MAGDWLKFESNLPEKPETLAITTAMGWDDPDLTVGKLMRLFRWFDQHTTDGNASGVTASSLDRIIGVSGFAQAVANCGWLVFDSVGVTLQKFDRHNGSSAKNRAQTAQRVARHRGKTDGNVIETKASSNGNAATVTQALAREEKRRDRNTPLPPEGGDPPGFASFWTAWPVSDRKQAKGKCLEAWKKARAEPEAALIVAHVEHMKAGPWKKDGGQFVPQPLTYLNQRRWEGAEATEAGNQEAFV